MRSPRFARIPPRGGTYYLPLGIAFQIPEGHYGRLAPKSGLAIYRSIGVLAGVVDQDYRGEVFVLLVNHDDKLSYLVKPEDKIVQLILEKATIARLQEVDTLDETERSRRGAHSLQEQSMVSLKDSGKPECPPERGWRKLHDSLWCRLKLQTCDLSIIVNIIFRGTIKYNTG